MSASCRSRGAAYMAARSASNSSSASANGRSDQASSATHGECSNSGPNRSHERRAVELVDALHRQLIQPASGPPGPLVLSRHDERHRRATRAAPSGFLARRFRFAERGTDARTEALGGVATFLTMCYILFVNPAILSAAGVPFDAVAVCTALAAAITTLAMGLATNLPFALAPGLGINAVVAFDIVLGRGLPWQVGMACVVIEGLIAVILVLAGLRDGDHARGPDGAEALDRRRHRPVHHARRPARGRHRRQQPGDRHRARRPHVRPGADHARRGSSWRPCWWRAASAAR